MLIFGRGNLIRDVSTGDASSRSGWHRGLTRRDFGGVFGYIEGGIVGVVLGVGIRGFFCENWVFGSLL